MSSSSSVFGIVINPHTISTRVRQPRPHPDLAAPLRAPHFGIFEHGADYSVWPVSTRKQASKQASTNSHPILRTR